MLGLFSLLLFPYLRIDDLLLVVDGFLVNGLEHFQDKFLAQSTLLPFQDHVAQNGVPSITLKYGHIFLLFQGANTIGNFHTLAQKVYQLVVQDINLGP